MINPLDFRDLYPLAVAAGRSLSYVSPPRPGVDHWRINGVRYDTTEAARAALEALPVQLALPLERRRRAKETPAALPSIWGLLAKPQGHSKETL